MPPTATTLVGAAEHHRGELHRIDAQVQQRPTAELGPVEAMPRIRRDRLPVIGFSISTCLPAAIAACPIERCSLCGVRPIPELTRRGEDPLP
jgi:hypothetical protein